MNGMAGGSEDPRGPGGITAPATLVVPRPREGWVIGLAAAGVKTLAGLLALVVVLSVVAGGTAVLCLVGVVPVPLVVVVWLPGVAAVCGFVIGRASHYGALLRFLPRGPEQVAWQFGSGRAGAGLVWEQRAGADGGGDAGVPEPGRAGDWPGDGGGVL